MYVAWVFVSLHVRVVACSVARFRVCSIMCRRVEQSRAKRRKAKKTREEECSCQGDVGCGVGDRHAHVYFCEKRVGLVFQ